MSEQLAETLDMIILDSRITGVEIYKNQDNSGFTCTLKSGRKEWTASANTEKEALLLAKSRIL